MHNRAEIFKSELVRLKIPLDQEQQRRIVIDAAKNGGTSSLIYIFKNWEVPENVISEARFAAVANHRQVYVLDQKLREMEEHQSTTDQ